MTPEQVQEMIQAALSEQSVRALQPDFVQWLVRASFEAGWRAAGGDDVHSHHSEPAKGWRGAWLQSEQRAILVRQGIISGQDTWR